MRKHCSNVCKLRLCLATESTDSARMRTIVTAALQRQYLQTELTFWIPYVYYNMIVHVRCKGTVGSKNYNLTFMHLKLLTIKVSYLIP